MKVKDLIQKLQGFDQEADIFYVGPEEDYGTEVEHLTPDPQPFGDGEGQIILLCQTGRKTI